MRAMDLFTCVVLFMSPGAAGQPTIGGQVRIDEGGSGRRSQETSAACSQLFPLTAVAAWNDNVILNAAVTTNGGASWIEYSIPNLPAAPVIFDPMSAADPCTAALWVGGATNDPETIWVSRWSGTGFANAVTLPYSISEADKPFMAAGRRPGVSTCGGIGDTSYTRLYVTYNDWAPVYRHYLSWSDAQGAAGSWQPATPMEIPRPPSGSIVDGALPRVGPNGELFVVFSVDGGYDIWLHRILPNASPWQFGTAIHVATRLDAWSYTDTINWRFPGVFHVPARAYLAVDPRPCSPDNCTLYCVYFDTTKISCPEPCQYDVDLYFTKSTDSGTTWSIPKTILGDDGVPYDQFFPWIEVDALGRIHLIYYDTRGTMHTDQDALGYHRAQYAYSLDGGASWTEHTLTITNWPDGTPPNIPFGFIGDYNGLGATTTRVYPIYMATLDPSTYPFDPPNEDIFFNAITWP